MIVRGSFLVHPGRMHAVARAWRTCDDGSLGSPGATMPFNPQVEATDPPFPTVPAEGATPELIAERIHVGVLQALGVVLAVTDDECIRTGLLADVDAGALVRIGLDGTSSGNSRSPCRLRSSGCSTAASHRALCRCWVRCS